MSTSGPSGPLVYFYTVKLLAQHHLEFLSLKGGYTCLSESTLVKMPHCWKSHVAAQLLACEKPSDQDPQFFTLLENLYWNPAS